MKKSLLILFSFLISVGVAEAHQPRLISNLKVNQENPVLINNPDVSQAFYGKLKGSPEYFQFTLAEDGEFYFGLLVPDLPEADKDFAAKLQASSTLVSLVPEVSTWESFYEEFAGDNYLKGPEKKLSLPAGTYTIQVSSPDNLGKYVLVVGEKESFPLGESVKTLVSLPGLKAYFNKPIWAVFQGVIGTSLLVIKLVSLGLIALVAFLVIRKKKQ